MKKIWLPAACLLFSAASFGQTVQKAIYYRVSFPNAVHHEAEIEMTVPQAPGGKFRVRMSRSSPGRYATHEFGKNVYSVRAANADGSPLELKQVEGDVYEVQEHGSVVKISYTLFGNWTDGTYAGIDPSHAHLNMPAAFMWVPGQETRPLRFEFQDLDKYGWKVATQLHPEGDNVYSAPNLQYMMDSPTELSAYKESSWTVPGPNGKAQIIRLTTHSDDDQPTIDNFAKKVQKVVLEAKAVYGELPLYDYGTYTFLQDVYPTVSGDGMEHRNSTVIVQPAPQVAGREDALLGTFSHEYFHSWNVERIRPKTLEPFNFEHANMSNELWFAEGFTQYYGGLLLERAGFDTPEEYTRTLTGLVNAVLNSPGAKRYSPAQASRYAVFADAGVSIDPNNTPNMFLSYYTYGGATALALDLRLRSEFNLTLDGYMRQVWLTHGKPEKPYTIADLQNVLARYTGKPAFAADFFKRYINGVEKNDYAALLAGAGLELRKAQPGKGWIGFATGAQARGRSGQARTNTDTEGFAITSSTVMGTPVYKAGIDAGDIITKADGKDIKNLPDLNAAIEGKRPGESIGVTYKNRTGSHTATVTLEENPAVEVVTYEKAGKTPNPTQLDFRKRWLESKVK